MQRQLDTSFVTSVDHESTRHEEATQSPPRLPRCRFCRAKSKLGPQRAGPTLIRLASAPISAIRLLSEAAALAAASRTSATRSREAKQCSANRSIPVRANALHGGSSTHNLLLWRSLSKTRAAFWGSRAQTSALTPPVPGPTARSPGRDKAYSRPPMVRWSRGKVSGRESRSREAQSVTAER